MNKFKNIKSTIAVLAVDNIDTDQIIGSDFLKITDKNNLGQHLFADWRFDNLANINPDFVLNQSVTKDAKVLVTGDNFGCGSSREHAPWALLDYGIQAVISTSIADIFYNNAIKNGLLPIVVTDEQHQILIQKNGQTISIDLETQKINIESYVFDFKIDPFAKYCLSNGIDQLDFLLAQQDKIKLYENTQGAII